MDGRIPGPMEKYGLVYCRGCEVIEVKDEDGKLMNDFTGRVKPDQRRPPAGVVRTLTVALDTAQYQADTNKHVKEGGEDVYATFNLLMRRKPKENNFKAGPVLLPTSPTPSSCPLMACRQHPTPPPPSPLPLAALTSSGLLPSLPCPFPMPVHFPSSAGLALSPYPSLPAPYIARPSWRASAT